MIIKVFYFFIIEKIRIKKNLYPITAFKELYMMIKYWKKNKKII